MSSLLGIGGAYAVSAGLIVYAIERGFVDAETAFPLLIAWAVAGLVLAGIAALKSGKD